MASAATAIRCDEGTDGCAGSLTAGSHGTAQFDHPFTFTVPDGWTNNRDVSRAYTLRVATDADAEFIVWSEAAPAQQTPDCSAARRPGFGTSVSEWLRSLTTDDRLVAAAPEVFDLGSHEATRIEIAVAPSFHDMCPFNTDPFPTIVTDTRNPPTRAHGGLPASLTLVDFGEDTIVIWNDGGSAPMRTMVDVSLPVIKSIRFGS